MFASMDNVKTILCATDFSSCANGALDLAVKTAKLTGAKLRLLHVYENPGQLLPMGGYVGPAADAFGELRKQVTEQLSELARAQAGAGVEITEELVEGMPHRTIIELAKQWKVDLIVLGTHGRTGLDRALTGSVAERVVRLAPCPVLVTREEQ
jgi:nucleotide-binding universal stress UspA family protein